MNLISICTKVKGVFKGEWGSRKGNRAWAESGKWKCKGSIHAKGRCSYQQKSIKVTILGSPETQPGARGPIHRCDWFGMSNSTFSWLLQFSQAGTLRGDRIVLGIWLWAIRSCVCSRQGWGLVEKGAQGAWLGKLEEPRESFDLWENRRQG